MKFFMGLIFFSVYINLSLADEFKLSLSQDIIDAVGEQPSELDGLSLIKPEKQNSPLPIPATQEKTIQSQSPESEDTEKKPDSPAQKEKSVSRVPSARGKPLNPINNFLPVQGAPGSNFFVQSALAHETGWSHSSLPVGEQNQMGIDPFDQLHDEMRLMVGEDIYAKMVWTYLDAKQLESWLYSTIDQSELFGRDSLIVGLNDQLMASLTSWGLTESNGQNFSAPQQLNNQQTGVQSGELNHAKPSVDSVLMKAEFESRSRFFGILNYLTIVNFLYLMLSIMVFVYTGKLFKFLVRQQ